MQRQEWEQIKNSLLEKRRVTPAVSVVLFDSVLMFVAFMMSPVCLPDAVVWNSLSVFFLTLALLQVYLLKHEATHSALFQNRSMNNLMGHLFGWMIFLPFLSRQRSHLLHHSWTGHPTGDPSNHRMIQRFTVMTEAQKRRLEFVWKSWFPMLAINDRIGLWRDPFIAPSKTRSFAKKERNAAKVYFLGYVAVIGLFWLNSQLGNFAIWYLPALFLLLVVEEILNLPHHAETPLLREEDRALPFWKQDTVTHSCRSVPIWSKYVILNFNLHTAHHYFPMLPWDLLPEAHQKILDSMELKEEDMAVGSEIAWSFAHRRAPLLSIMGHYFDRIQSLDPMVKAPQKVDISLKTPHLLTTGKGNLEDSALL